MDGLKPHACSCEKCRGMCAHSVCLPTPKQALDLLRKYPDKMGAYEFEDGAMYVAPATKGWLGHILPRTNVGGCVFFDGQKCELHDRGEKPLEGQLSGHGVPPLEVRAHVIKNYWSI